jgi:hypothetical protein
MRCLLDIQYYLDVKTDEVEPNGACNTHGKGRIAHRVLMGNFKK